MIDNVTPLRVVALPTADEEAKADAIRILEELLEEAKHGEIVEFAIVIMRPGDDMWDERTTPTRARSAWIGKQARLKEKIRLAQHEARMAQIAAQNPVMT